MTEILRRATLYDVKGMDAVNRRNLPENYPILSWMGMVTTTKHSFVLVDNGEIVGYSLCIVLPYLMNDRVRTHDPVGYVISLAVDSKYRGKGWGRKLLESGVQSMKAVEVVNIKLNVRVGNTTAQKLYESIGFKKGKTINSYYEDGEDAFEYGGIPP